ncbi:MAG: ArnT family glycosyltransferase [Chthoniobacterales bacterium]
MSTSDVAPRLQRWVCVLVVVGVWAAIYLPGLGTLEIKGEEGRRILPAVTMLRTGDYLSPQIGSAAYLRKPPLINWLVAASIKLTGRQNEWSARFPSALSVLAVALVFVTIARGTLGAAGALSAALIWLTSFGLIEKGRLIEIEALYASLTGLAFICWLSWWQERRSPWLTWTVPWIFLGLGLLAKGPVHLIFFYAVVFAILWKGRQGRELLRPSHWVGVIFMLGIFAAWAVPYLMSLQAGHVTHMWSRQFSGRLSGEDFHFRGWIQNIPRGLGYFLPWTLLVPVFWRKQRPATDVVVGLACGIAVPFVVVSLLPGALSRYNMPLLAPSAWLMAMLLGGELRWPRLITALTCVVMIGYGFAVTPFLGRREKVRNIAARINQAIPPNETLYAVDPDYQPWLFYVREPLVYLPELTDVPADARDILVQGQDEDAVRESRQWWPRRARIVLRVQDYRKRSATLLRIEGDR